MSAAVRIAVLMAAAGAVARADARPQSFILNVPNLELAVDRLMDDRRYPPIPNGLPGQAADSAFFLSALASPYPTIRAVAVRAAGRFEVADEVPGLLRFFRDPDPNVRLEAGNAVAMSLRHAQTADAVPAMHALLALISSASPGEEWVYDTLGRLPYATADADRVERVLADADRARGQGDPVIEAALANLIAGDPGRPVAPATRALIEMRAGALVAAPGPPAPLGRRSSRPPRASTGPQQTGSAGPSLPAWRALQLIGDRDPSLLAYGATYTCGPPECAAKIREIAVSMIDPNDPTLAPTLAIARHDLFLDVRLTALRQLAKLVPETKDCAPLVETIADSAEPTVMHLEALSLLDARCQDREAIATRLAALAGQIADPSHQAQWHEPARALEALARFDAAAARHLIVEAASTDQRWQVRAAGVRAATTIKEATLVRGFAADTEPNVRTEVVKALAALASPETTLVAIAALDSADYQLVDAAAEALETRPPQDVEVTPIVAALGRLTAQGKDTSHAPRKALLERLKKLAAMSTGGGDSWVRFVVDDRLVPLLKDFDPEIATLSADVIGIATEVRPAPRPTYRPPEQPTDAEIDPLNLPDKAAIQLDTGDRIDVTFLKTEAPIAIARFAALARRGYYNGSALYRVEPLLAARGGTPGANEYMGADRYFRDEIGLEHHTAGTIGLVTNGRDTGNGQFFIDLTDQPRFDGVYTAFARVVPNRTQSVELERILEGTRIVGITISQ